MLIDAGNNSDANFVTNYIKKAGINKIDYLVGTYSMKIISEGLVQQREAMSIKTVIPFKGTTVWM